MTSRPAGSAFGRALPPPPHEMRHVLLLIAMAAAACAAPTREAVPEPERLAPSRPDPCVEAAPGKLRTVLERAEPGDAVCMLPGEHPGPVVVPGGVTLWGPPDAVIRSDGNGSTVVATGKRTRLLGFTVEGSGHRFDTLDAAVKIQKAEEVLVEGLGIHRAMFGILVELTRHATIRGNHVVGTGDAALGMRGDSIRLWETHHSVIEENLVEGGRDMVVWYSSDNVIRRNLVRGGRYGSHLMYSHRNEIYENRYEENVVGIFVMYSRDIDVHHNVLAGSSGAAGMGLGLKESGNLRVVENQIVANTTGIYLDTSPLHRDDTNLFRRNVVRLGQTGVVFHSSQSRNTFEENSFRDNYVQVQVEGGGDAMGVTWNGNDFDDYAGYDMDGDGFGDVPYELRSLATDLTSRYPDLQFFRGSLTLSLINVASEVLPVLAPRTILRDPNPRFGSRTTEVAHAN